MPTREEVLAARPAHSAEHLALALAFAECDLAAVQTALESYEIDLNSQSFYAVPTETNDLQLL